MASDVAQGNRLGSAQKAAIKSGGFSAALNRLGPVMNPELDYPRRVKILRSIKTSLSEQEIDLLYQYLRAPLANLQDRTTENWLRNEMMDKLVEQRNLPGGLSDLLVVIYQDRRQDAITRDYALQHTSAVYDRLDNAGRVYVQQTLTQATREIDSSIAGTALLAMLRLTQAVAVSPTTPQSSSAIDPKYLANTALNLATNNNCGELSRITAVQVCGMLRIGEAFPIIEKLAEEATSMPLRIAATAALGDMGKVEAAPILKEFIASADPRQAFAARSALLRLAKQVRL